MTKRKRDVSFDDDDDDDEVDVDTDSSSNSSDGSTSVTIKGCLKNARKRPKRSVNFDGVTVYYFKRAQGFTCVPSEGGSTLGMTTQHSHVEKFSLAEYTKAQKSTHKMLLNEHKNSGVFVERARGCEKTMLSFDASDSDSGSELEVDDCYFLQPVPIRQRRMMLRCSGVKKIEISESDGCKNIRESREVCGCDCRGVCLPDACSCIGAGIKCQVDRLSFPCACTKTGCGNKHGRVEFNPFRVRAHFVHTLMRMDMEQAASKNAPGGDAAKADGPDSDPSGGKVAIDLGEYNSNEMGSCRDCQHSEVCHMLMHEAERQYSNLKPIAQNHMAQNYAHSAASMLTGLSHGDSHASSRVLMFNENSSEFYNAIDATSNSLFDYSNSAMENSYTNSTDISVNPPRTAAGFNAFSHDGMAMSAGGCSSLHLNNLTPVSRKFMDIASTTGYKLDPISEIMNPVSSNLSHFHDAKPSCLNWNGRNAQTSFSTGQTFTALSTETLASYTTMTNTTSDQIATTCPGISTHLRRQSQPEPIDELSPLACLSTLNNSAGDHHASPLSSDVVAALFTEDLSAKIIDDDEDAIFTPNLGPAVKAIIEERDDSAEISSDAAFLSFQNGIYELPQIATRDPSSISANCQNTAENTGGPVENYPRLDSSACDFASARNFEEIHHKSESVMA